MSMQIEETVSRESYRDFDLIELRYGDARRWHIAHKEAGMIGSYGFAASAIEAKGKVDALLKRRSEGRQDQNTD
jgi:hypothetical protein